MKTKDGERGNRPYLAKNSSPDTEEDIEQQIRSELIANMNHDLRTPLNAVIGFAQIIESEMFGKIDNPQYLEYVKHIQDSGYELLQRIEEMFGISQLDVDGLLADEPAAPVRKKQLAAVD